MPLDTSPDARIPGDFQRHPHNGAPYVNHPTDTTKAGKPRRVLYGRPSSFWLENQHNLLKWRERKLVTGLASMDSYTVDLDDRKSIDRLIGEAYAAADTSLAADRGTHVHLLTERHDLGQSFDDLIDAGEALGIPEALQRRIVEQWAAFRVALGVSSVVVEGKCVNDEWRIAGTYDRLDVATRPIVTEFGTLAPGEGFIGDIKTGRMP